MTKAALQCLSRGLAKVLADSSVTVNTILPGPTRTEGANTMMAELATERGVTPMEMEGLFLVENLPSNLLGRFATQEEVASLSVCVASAYARAYHRFGVAGRSRPRRKHRLTPLRPHCQHFLPLLAAEGFRTADGGSSRFYPDLDTAEKFGGPIGVALVEETSRAGQSQTYGEYPSDRIRNLVEQLDAHRKHQQAAHPGLTLSGMYNDLEKLRSGDADVLAVSAVPLHPSLDGGCGERNQQKDQREVTRPLRRRRCLTGFRI